VGFLLLKNNIIFIIMENEKTENGENKNQNEEILSDKILAEDLDADPSLDDLPV
jgi:hypothetical protein